MSFVARTLREVYRRELLPPVVQWRLAAFGMLDWIRVLERDLTPHLGPRTRPVLAAVSGRMFTRRLDAIASARGTSSRIASARSAGHAMSALYGVTRTHRMSWIFDEAGGATRTIRERLDAERALWGMTPRDRWNEVATHLGELLIVLTEDLPAHMPHARKVLGDACFRAGARYARHMRKALELPADPENAPALAIEVLRVSESVFRVNPEHWTESDANANTGSIEGTACPWYSRPGWHAAHCGIFGQFQSGIASEFGLRYQLASTIPKHGGTTCKIELKPVQLRRSRDAVSQNTIANS